MPLQNSVSGIPFVAKQKSYSNNFSSFSFLNRSYSGNIYYSLLSISTLYFVSKLKLLQIFNSIIIKNNS